MTRTPWGGAALAAALLALAVIGPWIAPDPLLMEAGTLLPPSSAHLLGTDQHSRDVFARLAHGARVSLTVAGVAVIIALVIGSTVGVIAGAGGSVLSASLRRITDLALALPRIVVLMVLLAALGTLPPLTFAMIIGVTGWPAIARLVRGETLRLRQAEYVIAARALGAPPPRVLWREILPGALAPAIIAATLGVADAILLEAGLSFLGLGIMAPAPSWGGMILESRDYLHAAPWLLLVPVAALVAATSSATLLGEALRRFLQPDTQ
ncbi:MAG: ABC transporter permease [Gemmatimonadales bacterium]|nr:ABC transporter permease [Gemmatimonadales bacterium]